MVLHRSFELIMGDFLVVRAQSSTVIPFHEVYPTDKRYAFHNFIPFERLPASSLLLFIDAPKRREKVSLDVLLSSSPLPFLVILEGDMRKIDTHLEDKDKIVIG